MLNVPTLWTVFVVNFLALSLIWAYVVGSYPTLHAARFWTASAFLSAVAAAIAMGRLATDSLLPFVVGGTLMIFATSLGTMGVARFYNRPASWMTVWGGTGLCGAGLVLFYYVFDSPPARILIFSAGEIIPLSLTLRLLISAGYGRPNPGAQLAAIVTSLMIAIYAMRAVVQFLHSGGNFTYSHFGAFQSSLVLVMVFSAMAWNFGCLLMAIDRLRNEVADLALMDDLTGVANRRHLLRRLTEECAISERSGQTFAILVIDLDGFKVINDTHGHAAGDACLQHFTLMVQTRLRPGDMLARAGGDEFCVVLPNSTVNEGAAIARRVLEVCREDAAGCEGGDIPIAVSIGVAQWSPEIGVFPDRLVAAADHALYAAKNNGKDGFAIYDHSPPLAPDQAGDIDLREASRKSA